MEPLSTIADLITLTRTLTPIFGKARKSFQWGKRSSKGIVKRSELLKKRRLPGEVFAAELLTEPVRIEPRLGGGLRVVIDRRNVEQAVITSPGKRELCVSFITPEIDRLVELDRSIHTFMRGCLSGASEAPNPLILPPLPFRWASGGIISIVKIGGNYHVPMFFRDIQPAGWNIPLGSSERLIDQYGTVLSVGDEEFHSPSLLILREFLEETIVLDRHPSSARPKRFRFSMPFGLAGAQESIAKYLQDKHRHLRRQYDHLEIMYDDDRVIKPSLPPLPMDLTIHSDKRDPAELSDVLIAINCLELGIEVVKIVQYEFPEGVNPYFLDGEILADDPFAPELVRMPVALFPLELLRELFEGDITLQYRGAAQAPLEIQRKLTTRDVTLFLWDIERRNAIIDGSVTGIGREAERYKKWKNSFGDFLDGSIPSLFTPATVKILNMLFSVKIV